MNYAKSLFYNFLTVYFANHLLPGIELLQPTRFPSIGVDLPFAIALGLLNSLIAPVCKLISQKTSLFRLAIIAIVLNFVAYAILYIFPMTIQLTSIKGYFLVAFIVSVGSFAINYFYLHSHRHRHVAKSSDLPKYTSIKPDEWKNPPS